MTELNEIYKCNICGNIVEITHAAAGQLVCCNQLMQLQEEKTEDEGQEKHVPVVSEADGGKIKVTVGSVEHPMEDEHYIEWIELVADGRALRKYLKPGDKPEAMFCNKGDQITVRAYCNVHGLWKA